MNERCWYMKFYPEKQCPNPGRWGSPYFVAVDFGLGTKVAQEFVRASRWCDEHRHKDDTLIEVSA